ncbi:MAG: 4-(cytidine 5'-diphospho)-2-C-methyl-D-erythritol kinase [Nitrospirae bacterium]|nr:4-(cytidine 5'-diphospho)-2-C-methyl-D-erythritol kinase [Nitrospirota bacterium]
MLTINAPAKINWFLNVICRRDDGFHEIRSVVQKIALYDKLTFSPSSELNIATDSDIPTEDNLVYKAARLLKKRYNVDAGALISLEKKIPVGAGLGGGSSDAAAALVGLNQLWSLNLSLNELSSSAQEIGSDVPLFLYDSISYLQGRGEKVVSYRALAPVYLLIVKPYFNVSTAWAYENFQLSGEDLPGSSKSARPIGVNSCRDSGLTKKADKDDNIRHFISKISKAEVSDIAGYIFNDLEAVTVKRYPLIAEIKDRLLAQGAAAALMSGSGSAVFGVFDSLAKAGDVSESFTGFWTAAVKTITD